jgi:hypothetical protein
MELVKTITDDSEENNQVVDEWKCSLSEINEES